ncbi:hypothetical protein GCM10027341_33200 [Spirosoma knui]
MRKIFLVLLLTIVCITVKAQNRARFHHTLYKDRVIRFPDAAILSRRSIEQLEAGKIRLVYVAPNGERQLKTICSKKLNCVISLSNGVPVVDFWQIEASSDQFKGVDSCINSSSPLGKGRYEIDLLRPTVGAPTYVVTIPFSAVSFGVGTIPFRMRLKVGDVPVTTSANLSFVGSLGKTFGVSRVTSRVINNYSVTLGVFGGLSSADIKKATFRNPSNYVADQTNVALSYGLSATFARNNLGLIISLGFDNSLGKYSDEWIYQNKPWIGFGINTNLGIF